MDTSFTVSDTWLTLAQYLTADTEIEFPREFEATFISRSSEDIYIKRVNQIAGQAPATDTGIILKENDTLIGKFVASKTWIKTLANSGTLCVSLEF